jgi:hypothetical protein
MGFSLLFFAFLCFALLCRHALKREPAYLPKFLLSVDWFDSLAVAEAYRLLYQWELPTYIEALQLLDSRFPDPKVRAYAVQLLGSLTDDELLDFMLQLTQLLKFEPFHDSALARFLLRRALANPQTVGHKFFWYLQAELHSKEVAVRFGVLINVFMRACGPYRAALGHQMLVLRRLEDVAKTVGTAPSKESRLQVLRERLKDIDLPSSFQLPLDPRMRVNSVIPGKCRYLLLFLLLLTSHYLCAIS